jgi:hypothetical protein
MFMLLLLSSCGEPKKSPLLALPSKQRLRGQIKLRPFSWNPLLNIFMGLLIQRRVSLISDVESLLLLRRENEFQSMKYWKSEH